MNCDHAVSIQGEQRSVPELERLVDQWLRNRGGFSFNGARDDLHVMLLESIEAKRLIGAMDFPVCANFRIALLGRPFCHVGVEALPVFDDRCKEQQIAALLQLTLKMGAQLVAGLGFDGDFALRTVLRSEPGE